MTGKELYTNFQKAQNNDGMSILVWDAVGSHEQEFWNKQALTQSDPPTFDERETKEIVFSKTYAELFHHGTPNHSLYMLVAKLANGLGI